MRQNDADKVVRYVVRCKDCKHHTDEDPGFVYCENIIGGWVSNDFFCAHGESMEQEDKGK